jgi:hypothetical protein
MTGILKSPTIRQTAGSRRIERTEYATPAPIEHVGIDHGRLYIAMAEQLLHCSNVMAGLEQMRGERLS